MFPEAVLSLDRIGVLMMVLAADTYHNTTNVSSSICILGILFDYKMSLDLHLEKVLKEATRSTQGILQNLNA